MKHNVTLERIAELKALAFRLGQSGDMDAFNLIDDAAYSLNCAAHEFQCIVALAERPKRYAKEIRRWAEHMTELGWTEESENP